jgi:hypothetical protein
MKHTPGPWKVVVGVSGPFVDQAKRTIRPHYVINQELPHYTPQVVTEEEAKANARLIAAAPSLFQHIKAIVDLFEADPSDQGYYAAMEALMPEFRGLLARIEGDV